MFSSSSLKLAAVLGGLTLLGVGCPPSTPAPVEPVPQQPEEVVTPSAAPASPAPTSSPVPTASQPAAATQTTVMITGSGFSPATVQVAAGTKVVFQNGDTKPHWVASDPHPVHTGLAGFDAGLGIATGGTYSFTFTKAGTFSYHDHLNPTLRGTVVVK